MNTQVEKEQLQSILDRVHEQGTKIFNEIGFDERLITPAKLEQMNIIFPKSTYVFTEEQLRAIICMAYAKGEANMAAQLSTLGN